MNDRTRKLLAVYLSTIMVFSVFASVAFTGPVMAATNTAGNVAVGNSPSVNVADATIDPSSGSQIPVAINFADEGLTTNQIRLVSENKNTLQVNNTLVSDADFPDNASKGNITVQTSPTINGISLFTLNVTAYDETTGNPIPGGTGESTITINDNTSPTISDVNITEGNFGNLKITFNSSEHLGNNVNNISVSVDGPNSGTDTYTFDGGDINMVGPHSSPFQYRLTTNQLFTDGTGQYQVNIDTAEDHYGNDGAGSASTDSYTYSTAFSSKSVENQAGGPDLDTSNVDMNTQKVGGGQFVFVRLENSSSGFERRDISGEGATTDTELWVNFTVDNFSPNVLQGTANVKSWNYTMNGDGSANVNVSLRPASIERNYSAWQNGVYQPSNWGSQYDSSDRSMDAVVDFGILSFPSEGGGPQGLDGARLTTDAQAYTVPKLDDNKNLTVDVASPHCRANASSPTNECSGGTVNDGGFYEAVIPASFYQQEWNVSQLASDEVNVTYSSSESAPAETEWNVTIRDDGAMAINGSNLHYSTGTINVVDQTGSGDDSSSPSPTTGEGGGGGGSPETTVSTTDTDSGTEATIERVTLDDPTVSVSTTASAGGVSVTEASATFGKASNSENTMSISASTSPPSSAPSPPNAESVVSYVDVTIEGSLADDVTEGRFTLDVGGSGVDPADVSAQRYDGGQWQDVETEPLDESTVEVVSPDGYSAFAIGASESSEPQQPTATPTPVETDTPVETATAADTPAGTATPTPGADTSEQTPESTATQTPAPTPTPGAGGPGFGVVAALLAFVATLAALRRR